MRKNNKYFVGETNGKKRIESGRIYSTSNLSDAIMKAFELQKSCTEDSVKYFVAKEIAYELKPNEKTRSLGIVVINNIKSKEPYYFIEEVYGGNGITTPLAKYYTTTCNKNLKDLLSSTGFPKLNRKKHLVRGLETKIEIRYMKKEGKRK